MKKHRSNRGSAMIIAIVLIVALAGLAAVLLSEVAFRSRQTGKSLEGEEAMSICLAGLEKARAHLFLYRKYPNYWDASLTDGASAWNSILAFNNGGYGGNGANRSNSVDVAQVLANFKACEAGGEFTNYRTGAQAPGSGSGAALPPLNGAAEVIFCQNKPFKSGGYHVVVRDNAEADGNTSQDTDRTVVVTVTATMADGTQRQVEAICSFDPPQFLPGSALLSEGNMNIGGNLVVQGTYGSTSTNGDLTVTGSSATVTGSVAAVGTITSNAGWSAGGGSISPAPSTAIPTMNPALFSSLADYSLTSDGKVIDKNGNTLYPPSGNGPPGDWNGFTFNSNNGWKFSGNGSPPAASYFVGADLNIAGFGNSSGMTASFFVQGDVKITGNGQFTPYLGDVALITSGSLDLSGTPGTTIEGFFGVAGEVDLSGNVALNGAVVSAANPTTGYALDAGGSVVVTYNNQINSMIEVATQVNIKSIRRLK